jgi:hypothetical protein
LFDNEGQEADDDYNEEDDNYVEEEDDDSGRIVSFDAPESGYGDDSDSDIRNTDIDQNFAWIVYWILKYQERYRLSDTATNSLIKFVRYLLITHDEKTYSTFPISLYMA